MPSMVRTVESLAGRRQEGPLWRTPILPLPAALLYPGRRLPMHIRDLRLKRVLEQADPATGLVSVATIQPALEIRDSFYAPVFEVVGVGRVVDSIPFPEGMHVTFEGISRARLVREERAEDQRIGLVAPLDEGGAQREIEVELANLLREVGDLRSLGPRYGPGLTPGHLADFINAHLPQPIAVKQEIFEILDVARRIRHVRRLLKEARRLRSRGPLAPELFSS